MTHDEFMKIKRTYFEQGRTIKFYWDNALIGKSTGKATGHNYNTIYAMVKNWDGAMVKRLYNISYDIVSEHVKFKKGDIVELYDGREFVFMNDLSSGNISCLPIGAKTGRFHLSPRNTFKINGVSVYPISKIITALLKAVEV
jgi:hypothetical protein